MQRICLQLSVWAFLSACTVAICAAQTEQLDADQIRLQIKSLNERLKHIDEEESDDYGQRVHAIGRSTSAQPPQEPTVSIRLYDLSDLFCVSPQYPAFHEREYSGDVVPLLGTHSNGFQASPTGGGMGGGGIFSVPPETRNPQDAKNLDQPDFRVSIESLIKVIKSTVAAEGGSENDHQARIEQLGNTLIVRADETSHANIANLLNLFREHWGRQRTVAVQAYLIRAEPAMINKLLHLPSGNDEGSGVIDEQDWGEFLNTAIENKSLDCSVTLVGHNSQTLHAYSGRCHQAVTDGDVITGRELMLDADGEPVNYLDHSTAIERPAGLSPIFREFQEGSVIQVTPFATRGGSYLIIDIQAKFNKLTPFNGDIPPPMMRVAVESGNVLELPIQRQDYQACQLNSTVRCPKGQVVLVGGMQSEIAEGNDRANLFLFVRGSIHTIEEDKSDRKPIGR